MSSSSRIQLERWLKTIEVPEESIVLDIGGAQKQVKGRTKTWNAKEYFVLDLAEPHEKKSVIDIIGDIQNMNPINENFIDIAFCLEVSEYWYNPLKALKNIALLLKKGGTLYISFHFIYCIHSPVGKDYLRYTPDGAKRILEEAGFGEIEHTVRTAEPMSLELFYKSEGMKGEHINVTGSLIKCKKL